MRIDVATYATGGSGTSGDPWTGWDSAISWGSNQYYFQSGYYSYATAPDFSHAGIKLCGDSNQTTVLLFTGTGPALPIDGDGTVINDIEVSDILIKGNEDATIGLYLNFVSRYLLKNVAVVDVTDVGIKLNNSLLGLIQNPKVTPNEGFSSFMPEIGLLIDGSTSVSTTLTVMNPIIEGISDVGIKLDHALYCSVIGGTSEGCVTGLELTGAASNNVISNIDLEVNSTRDILDNGVRNSYCGVSCQKLVQLGSTCQNAMFYGGLANSVTIDSGSKYNNFYGLSYNFTNPAGSIIDNGAYCKWYDLYSINSDFSTGNITDGFECLSKQISLLNNISNGDMELWSSGTTSAPDSWVLSGNPGQSISRDAAVRKEGKYSAKFTNSSGYAFACQQNIWSIKGSGWQGKTAKVGMWLKASDASRVRFHIYDGVGSTNSSYHSGSGDWEFITCEAAISGSATCLYIAFETISGSEISAYVDGAMCVEKS